MRPGRKALPALDFEEAVRFHTVKPLDVRAEMHRPTRRHMAVAASRFGSQRGRTIRGRHEVDLKEQVIRSQRQLIDRLVACEESVSRLYAAYRKTLPAAEGFWKTLSEQEATHARLLKMLHRQLDKGNVFRNLGRFDLKSIDAFLANIAAAISEAEKGGVSHETALATAMRLESAFLEAHFYDVVKSDSEEYRVLAARLAHATQKHRKLVQEKWLAVRSEQSLRGGV